MSFRKPHTQRKEVGRIDYAAGREEAVELPRGRILERVFLDVSFSIKKGIGIPTAKPLLQGIYQIIDRLTVQVGSDEIWKLTGAALPVLNQMDFGARPIQRRIGSLPSGDTEEKIRFIVPLSFDNPAMLKPLANALDLRGAPDAFVKIRWRENLVDMMFADPQGATIEDVVCNVTADPYVNTPEDLPLMPVRMIEMMDYRVYENRDSTQFRVRAGTDINLRRVAIVQSRDGNAVRRFVDETYLAEPILHGKCEVYSGATHWRDNDLMIDWAYSNILRERNESHSVDIIDFTRYGNRAEMVPTSEIADDIVIESAVKGPVATEECLVQLIIDGIRIPRWSIAQRG